MQRRKLAIGVVAVLVGCAISAQVGSSSRGAVGGIVRVSFAPQSGLDHIDPALSFTQPGWILLDTICARLMAYRDEPPPKAFELVPEVAAAPPTISDDFKTYTFRLRSTFRFSDGSPVRASAFAHAINRLLTPQVRSPGAVFARDIVGATDVLAGKAVTARGIVARGSTLVVRFTRPAPDFAARTSLPFFCAVPPGLPAYPEGVGPFSSAGPFTVTDYRPGERVVIRRNRFYGGTRPRRVDGFDVDLRVPSPTEMIRRIDRGEVDWGYTLAPLYLDPALGLVAKYGVNRSRFFVKPGLTLRMLAFNSSRPLFRDNPSLRRAVNFAVDRQALLGPGGGPLGSEPTDQYIPRTIPGYRNAAIYPLAAADLLNARALARGNLRGGKAVFYSPNFAAPLAMAQLVKQQLEAIGLEFEVRPVPLHIGSAEYLNRLTARDEQWDLALVLWSPNIADPHAYVNLLLEAEFLEGTTLARFESPAVRRELQRAARLLQSGTRRQAYGDLDIRLARDAAPFAALNIVREATLVSARLGCVTLRPVLDLATVCLEG